MKRFSQSVAIMIGLLLLTHATSAANTTPAPLHAGTLFPEFSGETLTGRSLTLPTAVAAKPAVLVFSFSRTAGKDARLWNEHLAKDFPNSVPAYGIILLESAPKIFRGLAVSGIQSTMPRSVQDRTIVLYRDEELWKQRLAVRDTKRAYVLLLGPSGNVCWVNSGAFSDSAYALLKNRLIHIRARHP
jgi:ATP10 protein